MNTINITAEEEIKLRDCVKRLENTRYRADAIWELIKLSIQKRDTTRPRSTVYSPAQSYTEAKVLPEPPHADHIHEAKAKVLPEPSHADGTDRIGVWTIILPKLLQYLKDTNEDNKIRQISASALGKWGGENEAKELANILLSEPGKDESLKIACIEALKTIGGIEAVKALVEIAANKDELIDVRYAALCDLEELGAGGWVDITDKPAPPPRKNIATDRKIRAKIETLDKISKDSDEPRYFRYQAEDALAYLEQSFSFQLVDISYQHEKAGVAKAKVTIQTPQGDLWESEDVEASAAIEAVFKAINQCFSKLNPCLTGYEVESEVEQGVQSLAEVKIKLQCENKGNYSRTAKNADTIWASANAYLQALNDSYHGDLGEESNSNSLAEDSQDRLVKEEDRSQTDIRLLNVSYSRNGAQFAKAKVTIQYAEEPEWESPLMTGDGPIEAVFKAIAQSGQFQDLKPLLRSFQINLVKETGMQSAQSPVRVIVRIKNYTSPEYWTEQTATNIDTIWASADAYLRSLIDLKHRDPIQNKQELTV